MGLDVAVEHPDTRVLAHQLKVVALAGANQHRVLDQLHPLGYGIAVGGDDLERVTVHVDRVRDVAQVHQPDQHPFPFGDLERRNRPVRATIHQEQVRAQLSAPQLLVTRPAGCRAGRHIWGHLQIPLAEHVGVRTVVGPVLLLRLDDERAVEPESNLDRDIGVGVVHPAPGGIGDEFVNEVLARLNRRLIQAGGAVHLRRVVDPMPMDGTSDRKAVAQSDPDAVTLIDVDLGAGYLAIVGPGLHGRAGHDLPVDLLRRERELPQLRLGCGARAPDGTAQAEAGDGKEDAEHDGAGHAHT